MRKGDVVIIINPDCEDSGIPLNDGDLYGALGIIVEKIGTNLYDVDTGKGSVWVLEPYQFTVIDHIEEEE